MDTMGKLMKCAANDDAITLRSEDNGDLLGLVFESKVKLSKSLLVTNLAFRVETNRLNLK